jgi:aminoglycoside phosphotransferase
VTNLFAENSEVAFMDVNLSDEAIRQGPNGEPWNPGAGGWPTVRYFNQETGIAGGTYVKKTSDSMCTELGNKDNMVAYVQEYAKMSLFCAVATEKGCSEKEILFMNKMKTKTVDEIKAEIERLESMDGSSMTPSLFQWLNQRKKILNQMVAAAAGETGASDEL